MVAWVKFSDCREQMRPCIFRYIRSDLVSCFQANAVLPCVSGSYLLPAQYGTTRTTGYRQEAIRTIEGI
eukprot:scaffold163334_cov47-Prasinocladus_malaysianus.AAC.1